MDTEGHTPTHTHTVRPTADDEVWVEDAQGSLVGALFVVEGSGDDEAEGDAGDALEDDEDDDQNQGAFVWHLQRRRTERQGREGERHGQGGEERCQGHKCQRC